MKFDQLEINKISLKEDEILVIRIKEKETTQATVQRFCQLFKDAMGTNRVVVYTGTQLEFLKLKLEEHLVDEFIEKELRKQ